MISNSHSNYFKSVNNKASYLFDQPFVPFAFLLCVLLLAYGYEIFGFHLTIDEELHADYIGYIPLWISQGRWGMGVLSAFIPSTVVPVVSPMLGVTITSLAWWHILSKTFDISRLNASLAVAVGITIPVLTFSITFSTLAYGIGFANLSLAVFSNQLVKGGKNWIYIGSLAGAFAISIYQTFIFSIFTICLFAVYMEGTVSWKSTGKKVFCLIAGALIIYVSTDWLIRTVLNSNLLYVGGFLDIAGFFNSPIDRLARSANTVMNIIMLSAEKFGLHSPWLAITLLFSVLGCFFCVTRSAWRASTIRLFAIFSALALPIIADAIATGGAPLRSGVYYSALVAFFIAFGLSTTGHIFKFFFIFSAGAAIIGNSVIDNRLFSASAIAYEFDRNIANEVIFEANKLFSRMNNTQPLKIDIIGSKIFNEHPLMPKKETFGASYFEWDGGNKYRVAAFLRLSGLNVSAATNDESAIISRTAVAMPAWPTPGWIDIDHGVLILKFGNYSISQEFALCKAGVISMCH